MYEADEMDSSVVLTQQDSLSSDTQTDAMPLVSVIIPAYNAEKYVEAAVRSMMSQTYRNLEILVTDDCSTDGTLAILNRLAAEDSRVRVFHNEQNKKIVATLNALVSRARGAYIARMDADDISLPQRIQKQVAFLEANHDIDFCGTNAWHIDENGKKLKQTSLPLTAEENEALLPFYCTFYHPTIMARAKVLKENAYSENFPYAEDYELWCRLVFAKKINGANLSESLLLYRISAMQTTSAHNALQRKSAGKVCQTYHLVSAHISNAHQAIFFTGADISPHETEYAVTAFRIVAKQRYSIAYRPAIRAMAYTIHRRQVRLFLQTAFTPLGLYALARKIGQAVRGKRRK